MEFKSMITASSELLFQGLDVVGERFGPFLPQFLRGFYFFFRNYLGKIFLPGLVFCNLFFGKIFGSELLFRGLDFWLVLVLVSFCHSLCFFLSGDAGGRLSS